MELAIIGAVIGLAGRVAQTSIALYEVGESIGSAAEEVRSLALELQLFAALLNQLSQQLERDGSQYSPEFYGNIASIIESCGNIYSETDAVILSFRSKKEREESSNLMLDSLSSGSRLRWLFKQRRVSAL